MTPDRAPKTTLQLWWKPLTLLIAVITIFIVFTLLGLDHYLEGIQPWITSLGTWGAVAFFFLYLGAVILAVPATPLGLLAGALFGSYQGVIIISISSTIGAAITFLIARYYARDSIQQWLTTNPKYKHLDDLTRRHGMIMVAIARLVPFFPFNIINYAFGLTAVKFRTYLFWSWLCMLPGTILFVVGADALKTLLTGGTIPTTLLLILITSLIATILLGLLANRYLKHKAPPRD